MANSENQPNSYLSFRLGNESYAAHVSKTLKILQLSDITKVPNAPQNVKGVINHHGNVLPVIDLSQTFGMGEIIPTNNTCIIILSVDKDNEQLNIGAIVDEVLSVHEVSSDMISDPPSLGKSSSLDHISGVYKRNDKFIMILDIDSIFKDMLIDH